MFDTGVRAGKAGLYLYLRAFVSIRKSKKLLRPILTKRTGFGNFTKGKGKRKNEKDV